MQSVTRINSGALVHRRQKISPKPLEVVFDMAFSGMKRLVSGAGFSLASSLNHYFGTDEINCHFLPSLLIADGDQAMKNTPQFFLLTAYDDCIEDRTIFAEAKKISVKYSDAFIIIGGPSVTVEADLSKLVQFFPPSTIMVKGEGDLILPKLIDILRSESKGVPFSLEARERFRWAGFKGLYLKHFGFKLHNEEKNVLSAEEFSALPTDYSLLADDLKTQTSLSLMFSRGCRTREKYPKCCVFCSHQNRPVPVSFDSSRMIFELQRIRRMILSGFFGDEAWFLDFADDDLLANPEAIGFLRGVADSVELSRLFHFDIQTGVNSVIDESVLDVLSNPFLNIFRLNIGIDGFSDKSLRFLRKPYNWARVQKAIAAINQLKIQHFGYVIFTFPSMTRRDLLEIVNNLLTLCLNFEHFNPIFANAFPTAFDGSKLMEQVDETGVGVLSDPEVLGYSKRLPTDIRPQDRYVNDIFYQEITEDEIRRVTKGLGWWVVEKLLEERAGFLERADDSSVFSLSDIFIHHRGLLKRDYSIALLIFMQKKMLQNFGAYEQ